MKITKRNQRKLEKLEKQFKRDNDLGMPYHKSDASDFRRDAFISEMNKSTDFVPTYKKHDEKFQDSWRTAIKNVTGMDIFFALFITLASTGFAYVAASNANIKSQTIKNHHDTFIVLMTVLGLLAGIGVGFSNAISNYNVNREIDIENFYNKLTVRLFDAIRHARPDATDLDENMLKSCNPEMARIIKALLIENMSENDTREIIAIAEKIASEVYTSSNRNQLFVYSDINREIDRALSLVQTAFVMNPTLYDTILAVYRGKVPATFALNQQQKIK